MTYGHPTRSVWGGYTFGEVIPRVVKQFSVDSSVRTVPEVGFSVDSLIGRSDQDGIFLVDSNVRAIEDAAFSVDAYNLRLGTDLYRRQETHPVILVELRLAGGTVRVANRDLLVGGVPYSGRLVNAGAILRTITDGTDEVQLSLDDTTTRGARFRDLFAANPPEARGVSIWLGLIDDPDVVGNRVHLFEGKVERVPGFSRVDVSLDVLRNEVVDDRLMGRLITLTDFPDAPSEVLGLVVPIVFGQVELSRGLVINTNAIGRLFFNHFIADTTIKLLDVGAFPDAGTIQVGDEQVAYTGRSETARELTGATRGANGTIAAEHGKDSEVRELGPFVVKFADHPIVRLEDIRIRDPQGNLGEPVPGPDSIDYQEATATWGELPRIRSSGVDALFQRVHFNAQAAGNLATDAQFAARENPGYDTFEYAKVSASTPLKIETNTNDLGRPGDIKRVWIAVVHDTTPPEVAEQVENPTGFHKTELWDVAKDVVFRQIFDWVPLPDGGFTNATLTAERVRDSIKDDAVEPVQATYDEMLRSVHGIPNGYGMVFSAGVATMVSNATIAELAARDANAAAVAAANAAVLASNASATAAGATVTFPGKAPAAFQLVAEDLTPISIARFDDRTNDRLYDVEVQIETPKAEKKTIIAEVEIEAAGIWSNAPKVQDHQLLYTTRENAESIFDLDDDNTGDAQFNVPGEVTIADGPGLAARVKFKDNQEEPADSGFTLKHAYIRVFVDTVTVLGYIYAPLLAYLSGRGGKIKGTEVNVRFFNDTIHGWIATGCILAPQEARSDTIPHGSGASIGPGILGSKLENLKDLRLVLEPSGPTGPSVGQPVTLICELEKEPEPPPLIEDRKGITNHFEVTEFVAGDWEFFDDPTRGGSITVESSAGELRVLEAFWVVEYQPFFDVSSSVPEVYADVTGKVTDGNPADICESIVTTAPPQGMGLAFAKIAREDYNPARAGFAADGVRADFTITKQVNALVLLSQLADECDFRQAWDRGRHRIVRKPAVGGIVRANGTYKIIAGDTFEAFRNLADGDVLRDTLGFSRTALADARTRIQAKFKPLPTTGDSGGAVEVIVDTAEVTFGRKEEARELGLIRDAATAELVVTRDLLRRSSPRWLVEMALPLFALELKLGDLVSLSHLDFSFAFGEVLDVSIETAELEAGPFTMIRMRLIVWQK